MGGAFAGEFLELWMSKKVECDGSGVEAGEVGGEYSAVGGVDQA